ncbi:hypothetical protein EDEG_00226 [Edhazardia aedis USNM 41457]|uniref:Uncharacterized protein n=1 Tax=Edhazardia aedis (strain USNM 41457) TaxID=1003232 RepID=J9D634_EDHAE|nr:hypothetical protein EDEG_00226 [Edhazardia aedis USNM 41457]|eukprot:EJW03246.1 hypothetical protein EDEG_00226 [Edhazardia aedis USNM 41457]
MSLFFLMKEILERMLKCTKEILPNSKIDYKENSNTTHTLMITNKNYSLKTRDIPVMIPPLSKPVKSSYICVFVVSSHEKKSYKLEISVECTIFDMLVNLCKQTKGSYDNAFISYKDKIFTNNEKNIIILFESFGVYQRQKDAFTFMKLDYTVESLNLYPKFELLYFDGISQLYEIRLDKILKTSNCNETNHLEIKKIVDEQIIKCKGCVKNISILCVDYDPLCSESNQFLCKSCFNDLFMDRNGKPKYNDIKYHFI